MNINVVGLVIVGSREGGSSLTCVLRSRRSPEKSFAHIGFVMIKVRELLENEN